MSSINNANLNVWNIKDLYRPEEVKPVFSDDDDDDDREPYDDGEDD